MEPMTKTFMRESDNERNLIFVLMSYRPSGLWDLKFEYKWCFKVVTSVQDRMDSSIRTFSHFYTNNLKVPAIKENSKVGGYNAHG